MAAGAFALVSYLDLRDTRARFERGACGAGAASNAPPAGDCPRLADDGKTAQLMTQVSLAATGVFVATGLTFLVWSPLPVGASPGGPWSRRPRHALRNTAVKGAVKLASGGHATVWLAKGRDGNAVARKCPHPHLLEDPDVRFALHREAEMEMRLHHRNVVQLRGVELVDDAPVLVLDYAEGANLAELVRDWRRSDRPATAAAGGRIGAVAGTL